MQIGAWAEMIQEDFPYTAVLYGSQMKNKSKYTGTDLNLSVLFFNMFQKI